MSHEEKVKYVAIMRRKYAAMSTKLAKGRVLDEFCEMTGLNRKHAIKKLNNRAGKARKRGRRSDGTQDGLELLIKAWRLSDMPCGKLLKPVLPMYLDSIGRRQSMSRDVRNEVLRMSASTIDRRLRQVKARCGTSNRRRASSLKEHRMEIPLKIEVWPDQYPKTPGWIEVDTVAFCGGSMKGSFIWALTMTDVGSGWTRIRCVWNKGAVGVCESLKDFIRDVPFRVIALNSDNGGEFINGHIKEEFAKLASPLTRSRSRSYRKNDNAHVEQKNGVQVRQLFGYGRFEDPALIPLMNEICKSQELLKNLFTPTMRLLSKERVGSKYIKKYEKKPKTPAQRLLESKEISTESKNRIQRMIKENDICLLRDKINADLRKMAKLLATTPMGVVPSACPKGSSSLPGPKASSTQKKRRRSKQLTPF